MADAPKDRPGFAGHSGDPKRQKTVWYVVGCIGLAILTVPCVGVLAAIAIPAFVNYTRRAKTIEARTNVTAISRGVIDYCEREHALPSAIAPTTTPSATRQLVTFAPAWDEVGFSSGDPLYYAYSIERPDAASLRVVAEGDLDADGQRSRYEIDCTSSCTCGELIVTNELE